MQLAVSWECWNTDSITGPVQWVKDPALPPLWLRSSAWIWSLARELHMLPGSQKRKKKNYTPWVILKLEFCIFWLPSPISQPTPDSRPRLATLCSWQPPSSSLYLWTWWGEGCFACLFSNLHVLSEIIEYLSFSVWHISLSMILLRSFEDGKILFFFMGSIPLCVFVCVCVYIHVYMDHIFVLYLLMDT